MGVGRARAEVEGIRRGWGGYADAGKAGGGWSPGRDGGGGVNTPKKIEKKL